MKVIIAGSRDIGDINIVNRVIRQSGWFTEIDEVVSSAARG